jgi:undecaprenyl-diphosphatase
MLPARLFIGSVIAAALLLPGQTASADDASPPPASGQATPGTPAAAAPTPHPHFTIDWVLDGVVVGVGGGLAIALELVLHSGEILATPPGPVENLLPWDRSVVTIAFDPNSQTYSDIGLYSAVGYAVLDPVFSGFRDGWDVGVVDAVMYAETISLNLVATNITKIAVRRPRPEAYVECPYDTVNDRYSTKPGCLTGTGLVLSFFSGHASTTAAVAATATYLAFVRDPHTARPWITLGAAVALTTFVSVERVRSGQHFPTDVVMGSMTGAAIGVLVPHLHRDRQEAPTWHVGAAPTQGGGMLTLGGLF